MHKYIKTTIQTSRKLWEKWSFIVQQDVASGFSLYGEYRHFNTVNFRSSTFSNIVHFSIQKAGLYLDFFLICFFLLFYPVLLLLFYYQVTMLFYYFNSLLLQFFPSRFNAGQGYCLKGEIFSMLDDQLCRSISA